MPIATLNRLWPGAFMVILGVLAAAVTYHFFLDPDVGPPTMVIEESHLVGTTLHPGENLEIRFTTSRYVLCHAITQRMIVNDDTGLKVANAESLEATYIQRVGLHQHGAINVKLPSDIPPGDYTYQAISYNTDCAQRARAGIVIAKPLSFTVVP